MLFFPQTTNDKNKKMKMIAAQLKDFKIFSEKCKLYVYLVNCWVVAKDKIFDNTNKCKCQENLNFNSNIVRVCVNT